MVSIAALSPKEALLTPSLCLRFIHQREEKNWKGEKMGEEKKRQRWRGGKKRGKETDTWSLGDMESHIHDVQAALGWDVAGLAGSAPLPDTGSEYLWWLLRSHLELPVHLC